MVLIPFWSRLVFIVLCISAVHQPFFFPSGTSAYIFVLFKEFYCGNCTHVELQIYFLWSCWIVCGVGRGHTVLVLLQSREFLPRHQPSHGANGRRGVSDQFFCGQCGLASVSSQADEFNGSYFPVCLGADHRGRSGRGRGHLWSVDSVLQSVPSLGSIQCVWSRHCCGADHFGRAVDFERCRPSCLQKETKHGRGASRSVDSGGADPFQRVQVQAIDLSKSQTSRVRPGYLRVGCHCSPRNVHNLHDKYPVLFNFDDNLSLFALHVDDHFQSLSRRCRVFPIADLFSGSQFDPRPLHSFLARGQDSLSRTVPIRGSGARKRGLVASGPTICVFPQGGQRHLCGRVSEWAVAES